jgi:hypothetical protein
MSTLRNNLDRARRARRAQRYPGDLADDVLPRVRGRTRRIHLPLAIAATVLIAIGIALVAQPGRSTPVADTLRITDVAGVSGISNLPSMENATNRLHGRVVKMPAIRRTSPGRIQFDLPKPETTNKEQSS